MKLKILVHVLNDFWNMSVELVVDVKLYEVASINNPKSIVSIV